MKKRSGFLKVLTVSLALAVSIGILGCKNEENNDSNKTTTTGKDQNESTSGTVSTGNDPVKTEDGYFFKAGGVTIKVDEDMDKLKSQFAEIKSVFEAPSCAGEGIAYIYNFGSFEIETYPDGQGINRIGFVTLKDDTVSTEEGIDLSMKKSDVVNTYGKNYEEAENMISYSKGGTKLNFIFDGENIVSIEYVSPVIG